MKNKISDCIQKSTENFNTILGDENLLQTIEQIVGLCIVAFRNDKKMLLCGNGGSASDAQHIAAEFIGKFNFNRSSLPALALTSNSSILTSISNDYSFDIVFSRQCESLVKKGDVVIGISTSGNSLNVKKGLLVSKKLSATTIGLLGKKGSIKKIVDISLSVQCKTTPEIQEAHRIIYHIICEHVEKELMKKKK